MLWKRTFVVVPALVLALGGAPAAHGQAEVDVLIFGSPFGSGSGIAASVSLGYTWVWVTTETQFLERMRIPNMWELVIFELPEDLVNQKEVVVQLLEDHVAAGGRLLVNFNNLDEWPRLQRLLGVSVARDVLNPEDVFPTNPKHHVWYRANRINVGVPGWPDSGDELSPLQDSITIGVFENGAPAMVLANDDQTIVNGLDWGSYFGASAMAHDQIEFLMECRADFDRSSGRGVLDLFDFLRFQDLFIHRDPRANMDFNSSFDLFDFLAFQDVFVAGCK